jgi:hypothetical protein
MDLKYNIIVHPYELLHRNNKQNEAWLNEVVANQNITLEIPITSEIFYPLAIFVNPLINGVSRLMMLKSAFYFYLESDIDQDFLTSFGIEIDKEKKCWYDYISTELRVIQSIDKIDDDEFMLVSSLKITPIIKKDNVEHISVLCKSCYWLTGVKDNSNIALFFAGEYKCPRCKNTLVDAASRKSRMAFLGRSAISF